MKKIILPLLFTILFIPVIALIFIIGRLGMDDHISSALSFTIQSGGHSEEISPWSADGENYYVFLPSYAKLSDLTFHLNNAQDMFLCGLPLTEGFDLSSLELRESYELDYPAHGAVRTAHITFLQSKNAAAMYIDTESGSMNRVHANKDYKENAKITLIDTDGNINYQGLGSDRIKGRGNNTWRSDKKPYTLQLDEPSAMLGMNSAKKWVLLSSPTDVSNIRNKIVYDFARETALYWTPGCEYVDLYLNGEYSGLYLLTEKIEVAEERLNIGKGAYLFSAEAALSHDFSTKSGMQIRIRNSKDLTKEETDDANNSVHAAENAILNASDTLFDMIDLDSWARKYLIEEIFENVDAGLRSQFFYAGGRSSKIFAGPIWDYDLSLGSEAPQAAAVRNPRCFYASTAQKTAERYTLWYAALYNNDVFYNRMVEI